ncbi:MAG: MATE family efflux transporter, partial [Clostridia bacterium]|nr:MATE family efflux transporter [Clostridia bacterium]
MKKTRIDMCNGPMFGKMISYTIPIIFTGILQLLFNAADLIVVGRFSLHGSNSVAAIGATGALCNLLVNFFIGCSMGSGVVVAQAIGGKNYKEVHNSIHTAIPIALVGGVILSVVGIFYSKPLLVLMGTPKDIINLSSV